MGEQEDRYNRKKDERENNSRVVRGLAIKIRSHINPPEPKDVIPLQINSRYKMESIMQNYKKDAEMENEMDMVDMGNFVKYDENGHFTFRKCPYCYRPLMGHIQSKCPKVRFDKDAVEQFEIYLENLGGFHECWVAGYMKYREKVQPQGGERSESDRDKETETSTRMERRRFRTVDKGNSRMEQDS